MTSATAGAARTSAPSAEGQPRLGRLAGPSIPTVLVGIAVVGWGWSVRMDGAMQTADTGGGMSGMDMATSMSMPLVAFVVGWAAMMAAMMFPAISPMVKMYARAAARGSIAPVPFFVAGYLMVWTAIGVPAYLVWQEINGPLAEGAAWTGRLAAVTFLVAAGYQLSPFKAACLEHCRSPISFFIHHGGSSVNTPFRAARLGGHHGLFCLGCCWAIMAVLVALGTMNLLWMAVLTVVIYLEKVATWGTSFANVAAAGFGVAGIALLVDPSLISTIT